MTSYDHRLMGLTGLIMGLLFLPAATLASEPTKEQTIAWLYSKNIGLVSCEEELQDGVTEYVRQRLDFINDGDFIRVRLEWFLSEPDGGVQVQYYETVKVRISDLSSQMELGSTEHTCLSGAPFITMTCYSYNCVSHQNEKKKFDDEKVYDVENWEDESTSLNIILDPSGDQQYRIRKALSHLVRLSGGGEKPADDLF